MPEAPIFGYNAFGTGISGFIESAQKEAIPPQLMCVLPSAGGHLAVQMDSFAYDDVISVKSGWAKASGRASADQSVWETVLEIGLVDCSIFGQILIEEIALRLQSSYPRSGQEPSFDAGDSYIKGLRIRGKLFEVQLDGAVRYSNGPRATLVTEVRAVDPDVRISRNVIAIPGFGRVRLADLVVTLGHVSLSMLIVDADSPQTVAHIALASGSLGGRPILPPSDALDLDAANETSSESEHLEMGQDEFEEVLSALLLWASSHPSPHEPFLFLMGRVFTPKEFSSEVRRQSRIGIVFLNSLYRQAKQNGEAPVQAIRRAVAANQPEML